jgi:hypothetical protein
MYKYVLGVRGECARTIERNNNSTRNTCIIFPVFTFFLTQIKKNKNWLPSLAGALESLERLWLLPVRPLPASAKLTCSMRLDACIGVRDLGEELRP